MNRESAETAIMTSALVVAIIYGYRRLEEATEPGLSVGRLVGAGSPVNFAAWATAWGTVFFMLALTAELAPGPAGAFAILTATSDVLVNGRQLFGDLAKQTTGAPQSAPQAPQAATKPQSQTKG